MAKAAERLAKLEEQRARINAEIQRVKAREQSRRGKVADAVAGVQTALEAETEPL